MIFCFLNLGLQCLLSLQHDLQFLREMKYLQCLTFLLVQQFLGQIPLIILLVAEIFIKISQFGLGSLQFDLVVAELLLFSLNV